jgi:hypothetical protein
VFAFPRLLVALRGCRAGAVMLGSAGAGASGGSCILSGNAQCGVELGKDVMGLGYMTGDGAEDLGWGGYVGCAGW